MNVQAERHGSDAGGTDNPGSEPKSRPFHDASGSEATREMRDTSRRRRDAEEKLQQHLLAAKEHVPHHHEPDKHPTEDVDLPDVDLPGADLPGADSEEKDPEGGAA